jgi:flagellar biosynthesis protein FliQ
MRGMFQQVVKTALVGFLVFTMTRLLVGLVVTEFQAEELWIHRQLLPGITRYLPWMYRIYQSWQVPSWVGETVGPVVVIVLIVGVFAATGAMTISPLAAPFWGYIGSVINLVPLVGPRVLSTLHAFRRFLDLVVRGEAFLPAIYVDGTNKAQPVFVTHFEPRLEVVGHDNVDPLAVILLPTTPAVIGGSTITVSQSCLYHRLKVDGVELKLDHLDILKYYNFAGNILRSDGALLFYLKAAVAFHKLSVERQLSTEELRVEIDGSEKVLSMERPQSFFASVAPIQATVPAIRWWSRK